MKVEKVEETLLDNVNLFRLCPYCGNKCQFRVCKYLDVRSRSKHFSYIIAQCANPECRGIIFGELNNLYPKAGFLVEDEAIPQPVLDDYNEAVKCFEAGAFKATAVMCRRTLQHSVKEKGGKGQYLNNQIDDLYKKKIITEDIKNWAHQIRMFGAEGAHPNKANLDFVDKNQANICLEFLTNYFRYVYEMPYKLTKSQKKFKKLRQKKLRGKH